VRFVFLNHLVQIAIFPGVNPKQSAYLKSIYWPRNWTFSSQLANAN